MGISSSVTIDSVISFSEQGHRANNEDFLGCLPNKLYVVCDGVGGSEKGEVASKLVVESLLGEFSNHGDLTFCSAVSNAEKKIDDYLASHDEARGMATTMVALLLNGNLVEVGWVGDSRLYHFRNGSILFKTRDHSWVNDALDAGFLTPEEAVNHPKSNVITRAIQGAFSPTTVDRVEIGDLEGGDLIMLFSDGVSEYWDDDKLCGLVATWGNDCESIAREIVSKCRDHSRDNFTGFVMRLIINRDC